MPRKHLIVLGINKKQQSQAKLLMKLAKEIKNAAKIGGNNIDANPRLKAAIGKALLNNLSKESIDKNIFGTNKENEILHDLEYELYAQNGLQLIVSALSDNANRTISSIKGYASKLNGNIAKQNSVKNNFRLLGEFLFEKNDVVNADFILEKLNLCPIEDIIENEDCIQVLVKPKDFLFVNNHIEKNQLKLIDHNIKYIPYIFVDIYQEQFDKLEKFLELCNNDDDIQSVATNLGEII